MRSRFRRGTGRPVPERVDKWDRGVGVVVAQVCRPAQQLQVIEPVVADCVCLFIRVCVRVCVCVSQVCRPTQQLPVIEPVGAD